MSRRIGNIWSFPHTQLYTEPSRLVSLGMVRERQEAGGRRRRVFTITAAGRRGGSSSSAARRARRVLRGKLRDLGMLKLFFGGLVDPEDVVALATEQEKAHRTKLQDFEALEQDSPGDG